MPAKIIEFGRQHGLYYSMAVEKLDEGKKEEAARLLVNALEICPDEPEYLMRLAEVYISLGMDSQACIKASKALLFGMERERVLLLYAHSMFLRGEYDRCKAILSVCKSEEAKRIQNEIMFAEELSMPVRRPERRAKNWGIKGCAYLDRGLFENAEYCLRQYTRLKPGDAAGHLLLAKALNGTGRHDEAVKEAEAGLEVTGDKDKSRFRCLYASVLLEATGGNEAKELLWREKPEAGNAADDINYILALRSAGMHKEIHSFAQEAISCGEINTFFLNALSVSALKAGLDEVHVTAGWQRILNLIPEEPSAKYLMNRYEAGKLGSDDADYVPAMPVEARTELDRECISLRGDELLDAALILASLDEAGARLALNALMADGSSEAIRLVCLISVRPDLDEKVRQEAAAIMMAMGWRLPREYARLMKACKPCSDEILRSMSARSAMIIDDAADYEDDNQRAAEIWQEFIRKGNMAAADNADAACAALICAIRQKKHLKTDYRSIMKEYKLRPRQLRRMLRQLYSVSGIAEDFENAF